MAKEFKTFAQLIELLEGRGVATDTSTTDCLRRESYYAVVNGYKAPSKTAACLLRPKFCKGVPSKGGIPYVYGISTWQPSLEAAPVDKLRISTRIKSIAVEAFGRHLKRVGSLALFFVWM